MTLSIRQEIEQNHGWMLKTALGITSGNSEAAADLVQDAAERLIRFEDKFQPGTSFQNWAFIIMRNIFINQCVKNQRLQEIELIPERLTSPYHPRRQNATVHHLADGLSRNHAIVLELTCDGYNGQEIADILNIPWGTVRSRIYYARQYLKRKLEELK